MTRSDQRRVSVVTGGTDGIGRAIALALAQRGDRVLIVGRDAERGAAVQRELEIRAPDSAPAFLRADLALMSETSRVASSVSSLTERVDALVCSAGVLSLVPEWTSEGLERSFALNYLSRFLLVSRLATLLERSEAGRVVLVANAGRYPDTLDLDDLDYRRGKPGLTVSGRAQFANDLLAAELAAQSSSSRVRISCVFPGVTQSSCFRNARGLPWFARWLAPLALRLLGRSPEAAAETPVALAAGAAAPGGLLFGPRLRPIETPARVLSTERRKALWEASVARLAAI